MRLAAFLTVILIVVTGCGGSTPPSVLPAPHRLSTLNWAMVGVSDVPTLDPALASDPTSISVCGMVYGGLVRLDRNLQVQPDGASSWRISGAGRVYTFTIRRNLRFASGRRVTARDFADALERALGAEGSTGTASFYLSLIAARSAVAHGRTRIERGITVLSPSRLQITLVRPAAHFLAELAFPASYVPDPSLLTRFGATWTERAAGFGPYSVQLWRHGRSLVLARNRYYYRGEPPTRRITVRFDQSSSALTTYKRGATDVVSGLQPGESFPGHPGGIRKVPGLALDYLAFNTTRLPFRHINARRALAAAWTPRLAAVLAAPQGIPINGLLPAGFGVPSTRWQPRTSGARYLRAARYPDGRGFPVVVLVVPYAPHLVALAHDLRRIWSLTLHIDVVVRPLNASNYSRVLNARAFDLALVQWGADYPDAENFLGTQLGTSPDNITGWSKPAYEHAILLADSYSPTDPRRTLLEQRATELATRSVSIVPLEQPALYALIRPKLTGVSLTGLGTLTLNPAQLALAP